MRDRLLDGRWRASLHRTAVHMLAVFLSAVVGWCGPAAAGSLGSRMHDIATSGRTDLRAVAARSGAGGCQTLTGPTRKAVLDAVRVPVEQALGRPVVFVVSKARLCGSWAFVVAEPTRPRGTIPWQRTVCSGDTSHLVGALVEREADGTWRLAEHALCPSDVPWVDWPQKHGAPAQVFDD